MGIQDPSDPVARRRLVRLQYLGILLVVPKFAEIALRAHFHGSALHAMRPYFVRSGGVDTVIPAPSWRLLIIVECLSLLCMVLFFVVLLRMLSIARRAGA